MKKLLTTICILLSNNIVQAQDFSIGARTGIGNMTDVTRLRQGSLHTTWDKELFMRYETKGRLAFEAGATQFNYTEDQSELYKSITICFPSGDDYFYSSVSQVNNYSIVSLGLSAQYDITCKYMQNCPLLRNLRSYIGLNANLNYSNATITYTDQHIETLSFRSNVVKSKYINNLQLGLSHTLKYNFNKLYLSSVVSYGLQPRDYGLYSYQASPNSKLSMRLGIGYAL